MPPSGNSAYTRQGRFEALDTVLDGSCISPEFLPERDRRRVHEMGAAGLHDVGELLLLEAQSRGQMTECRDEIDDDLARDGEMDRGGEHVVRRL